MRRTAKIVFCSAMIICASANVYFHQSPSYRVIDGTVVVTVPDDGLWQRVNTAALWLMFLVVMLASVCGEDSRRVDSGR